MPKAVVTDGYTIDEHIPLYLRDMFYKSSYPQYTYCTTDGYGSYDFSTNGLVLYLPLWALKGGENGTTFKSVDAYQHSCTVFGALWQPDGRLFDGSDDKIDTGTAFQSIFRASFSFGCWFKATDGIPGAAEYLGGSANASAEDRVYLQIRDDGKIQFLYASDGDMEYCHTNVAMLSNGQQGWHLAFGVLDATVEGAGGMLIYFDGAVKALDATNDGDTTGITSADWTSADELWIGDQDNNGASNSPLLGVIGDTWLYNRVLTAAEILHIYNSTVWRYQ